MFNRLRGFRKQQSLTQEEMAEALQMTRNGYQKLEYKNRRLNEEVLRKLKAAFPSLDLNEFLK